MILVKQDHDKVKIPSPIPNLLKKVEKNLF